MDKFKIVDVRKEWEPGRNIHGRYKDLIAAVDALPAGKGLIAELANAAHEFRQAAHNTFRRKGQRISIVRQFQGEHVGKYLICKYPL